MASSKWIDVCKTPSGHEFKEEQKIAIQGIIEGRDVLAILPTGYGKSAIYQSIPSIFKYLNETQCTRVTTQASYTVVLVISPLVALMDEQATYLNSVGISATVIRGEFSDDLLKARISVVFSSPECIMTQHSKKLLLGDDWQKNLTVLVVDEAHCISEWGQDFRPDYADIGDLRSLLPGNIPILSLTATATLKTQQKIVESLHLRDPIIINRLPNRPNIIYSVFKVVPRIKDNFQWLVEKLHKHSINCDRVTVYCSSVGACSELYSFFHTSLGEDSYYPQGADNVPENRLFGMFHRSSTNRIKSLIISSLSEPNGVCRIVFATVALGMGINCVNIRHVIHYGCPRSLEAYCQESGRGGRDGKPAYATLLYRGIDLGRRRKIDLAMKQYCIQSDSCHRLKLLSIFIGDKNELLNPQSLHPCCNVCASKCNCKTIECVEFHSKTNVFLKKKHEDIEDNNSDDDNSTNSECSDYEL